MARSTRPTPVRLDVPPSCNAGHITSTTPPKPISSPMTCGRVGSRRSIDPATIAATRGIAPFSIPASDDEIHCSATEKHVNGMAIHVALTNKMRGHSRAGTERRLAGRAPSASAPKPIRPAVTTDGAKCSRPTAMNRNEKPQINGGTANSSQSAGPNACASCVPSTVDSTRAMTAS
jgi:hypothetical protein